MTKTQINLLSQMRPSGGGPKPPQFVRPMKSSLFVLLFAFIIIGFEIAFAFTFYQNLSQKEASVQNTHGDLQENISALEQEVAKLKSQPTASLEDKKREARLLQLSYQLKTDSKNLIKILETVGLTLPAQAWMSELSQKETAITIHGFATDNEAISNFLEKLKQSNSFDNVKLVVSEHIANTRSLKKFTITCDVGEKAQL
ncbi:MAG: hypothetical protein A2Z91_04135 [Deltaproteobacteria bacterium GWA2_38_16]|nr:MAG: hypothetical protein A2Z91_04135 [Deltaproteobacteria bacterium GWA2_38_16]OGQ01805.1 MAG: hypothetical protein A3D19_08045 [Deltaproteobacteria bacterium RIFCSPHIGHO2_02_FULL_38_15]OGQ30260.1 MAG: hypothetical protein A3A72_08415 [Deltaproteobacteria bacterium RIFCSPLOWO2_01_FULL_38_9]OGQ58905.1 MAG: hypothetical protein A3G92_07865 [Deltaproteobacteria bacterium RIFCSPLOWO2_12_FULL_38_8]HBQ21386.1 hypothetical protein [Deltaproteobacteria bacterium]